MNYCCQIKEKMQNTNKFIGMIQFEFEITIYDLMKDKN